MSKLPASLHHTPITYTLFANNVPDRDNLDDVYEGEKQHQIKDKQEGHPHWKQELASNSEAFVKADREEMGSDSKNPKTMQERTKDIPNQQGKQHQF